MADVQVTCIRKNPRNNTHEGITHLGGYKWEWTRQQVVDSINNKTNTFYTMKDGVGLKSALLKVKTAHMFAHMLTVNGLTTFYHLTNARLPKIICPSIERGIFLSQW